MLDGRQVVKFLDQSKAVDADVVLMYATAAGATQQTTVLDREISMFT